VQLLKVVLVVADSSAGAEQDARVRTFRR